MEEKPPPSSPPAATVATDDVTMHHISPFNITTPTSSPSTPKLNTRRVLAEEFEFGHGFGPLAGPALPQSSQNAGGGPAAPALPVVVTIADTEDGGGGGGNVGDKKKKKKKKKDKDKGKEGADGGGGGVAFKSPPTETEMPSLVSFKAPGKPNRGVLVPPLNFGMVLPGIYRSGYPNSKNFPFLKKLGVKSVVYLCPDKYMESNRVFFDDEGINLFQFSMRGNLEPFVEVSQQMMCQALAKVIDKRHHPVLIHCQKGNHRTGCLVGCMRRLMNWSLTSIQAEYRRFTGPNVRLLDMLQFELFDPQEAIDEVGGDNLPAGLQPFLYHSQRTNAVNSTANGLSDGAH